MDTRNMIFVPIEPGDMSTAVFFATLLKIIPSVHVEGLMARMPSKAVVEKELKAFYFQQFEEYDLQELDEPTAEGILRERLTIDEWKVFSWLVYITNP